MAISKVIQLLFKIKGAGQASQKTKEVDSSLANLAKTAIKVGVALKAAQKTLGFMVKTAEQAGKFEGIAIGFGNLARDAGFSANTLEQLREATDGTVDSIQLMELANNAMLLGIADSSEQMAEMFDIAQRLGVAMGKDTRFGVESLVTGMGRQSKLMLDNLGIMVDLEEANKRYAKELKKSAKELTEAEKKQAFNNEAIRQGRLLVGKLGEETFTSTQKMDQMRTALSEAGTELGTFFTPLVNAGSFVVKGLAGATANLVGALNDFLGLSPELGGEGSAPDQMAKALDHIKTKQENLNLALDMATTGSMLKARDLWVELNQEVFRGIPLYTQQEQLIAKMGENWAGFDEIATVAVPKMKEANESWLSADQQVAVDMTKSLANNLASAVIHGQNLGNALTSSLQAIAIEMAANAALFLLLQSITGGAGGSFATKQAGEGGFMGFLLKGFTGQSPKVNVNINGGLVSDSYVRNTLVPALNSSRVLG